MAPASVELDEAIPLLGAHACRLAQDLSVRVLLIKGAPATALGVRSDRPSIDVDLWVDPREFDAYRARLEQLGWREKPGPPEGVGWGHAVTLVSPDWPCSIDLHRRFPGFLTDDDTMFELAWRGRSHGRVGQIEVAVPGRVVAAAITVLHAERQWEISETACDRSSALAVAAQFTAEERAELDDLVGSMESPEPLRTLAAAAGTRMPAGSAASPSLDEWRLRLRADTRPGGVWWMAVRQASWRRRSALLAAAASPTDLDYAAVGAERTAAGWARAATYRWGRWVKALLMPPGPAPLGVPRHNIGRRP